MRRITIKLRLYATAIGIVAILFIIGIIANFYIYDVISNLDSMSVAKDINYAELRLRNLEKDFVNIETKNPDFYKTKRSNLHENFTTTIDNALFKIEILQTENIIKEQNMATEMFRLRNDFLTYRNNFDRLVELTLEKGFKDYGLIGDMRAKIHQVETLLESQNVSPTLQVQMLTLRRNEKDYLLRNDIRYLDKFRQNIATFNKLLDQSNLQDKAEFKTLLSQYLSIFEKVIQVDVKLGLNNKSGITNVLNASSSKIEAKVNTIQKVISEQAKDKVNKAIQALFIISTILTALIIIVLLGVTNRILLSVKRLRDFILRLGNGELPENLVIRKNDEIADIIKSINILLENLRNTREFALEVAKGNLEKQVDVFGNRGDLGGALIGMRHQLNKIATERAQNQAKEQLRNWHNEGIAKFSQILRNADSTIENTGYQLLSELIDYVEANQGAIFIIHDDENDGQYLQKIAAVAYGRKKLTGERIEFGQDLVGRCAFEKKTIYMNDIPDNYIQITSGLGYATPKHIFLAPILKNNNAMGVIEIASFNDFHEHHKNFIIAICEALGETILIEKNKKQTQILLDKAKEQADEIMSQEEELRQTLEEMQATQEEARRREEALQLELHAIRQTAAIIETDSNCIIVNINHKAEKILDIHHLGAAETDAIALLTKTHEAEKLQQMVRNTSANGFAQTGYFQAANNRDTLKIDVIAIRRQGQIEKIIFVINQIELKEKIKEQEMVNFSNILDYN